MTQVKKNSNYNDEWSLWVLTLFKTGNNSFVHHKGKEDKLDLFYTLIVEL